MAKQVQHSPGPASATTAHSEPSRAPALARLVGFSEEGYAVVRIGSDDGAVEVPSTVVLGPDDIDGTLLVTFVDGRSDQPLVSGRIQPPLSRAQQCSPPHREGEPLRVEADGEVVTIEAERELVLRCGKARLRLRKDGFVEVRGIDVVSRAERSNWIKGGSVALN